MTISVNSKTVCRYLNGRRFYLLVTDWFYFRVLTVPVEGARVVAVAVVVVVAFFVAVVGTAVVAAGVAVVVDTVAVVIVVTVGFTVVADDAVEVTGVAVVVSGTADASETVVVYFAALESTAASTVFFSATGCTAMLFVSADLPEATPHPPANSISAAIANGIKFAPPEVLASISLGISMS